MGEDGNVRFKSTNISQPEIELSYGQSKIIEQYREELAERFLVQAYEIKLIHKGKILLNKQKIAQGSVVMVVVSQGKKSINTLSSAEQIIPKTSVNMSTGLGASSPVGFGGYGIMNHPQYMSAMSSVTNQQKLEEMMDDPYYQGMMEEMMNDPDTLKQLLSENPMMKNMMDSNPMMKMVMDNPDLMKMVFNPDTIKMAKEMKKNGTLPNGAMMGQMNPMMGQMNPMMGHMNPMMGQTNPMMGQTNPMMGQMNGMNPMMGQGLYRFYGNNGMNAGEANGQNTSSQVNPMSPQHKYKAQLKQLQLMGFSNRQKNIEALKSSSGNVDTAIEKLCQE